MTRQQVEMAFLMSEEYQAAHADDSAFVEDLYADVLGRPASTAEVDVWLAGLDRGLTRIEVVTTFLTCEENCGRVVEGYYRDLLHRDPDALGFAGWVDVLRDGLATREQVLLAFLGSEEYLDVAIEELYDGPEG